MPISVYWLSIDNIIMIFHYPRAHTRDKFFKPVFYYSCCAYSSVTHAVLNLNINWKRQLISRRLQVIKLFLSHSAMKKTDAVGLFFSRLRLFTIDLCALIIYDQIMLNTMRGKFLVRNVITRSPCIIAWCDRQLRRLVSLQAASDLRNNYSQLKPSRQRPKIRCFNFCMKSLAK